MPLFQSSNGLAARNGQATPRLIDPATGQPFKSDRYDEFPIPHVMTGAWIIRSGHDVYLHGRFDEALRKNREDALAMRRDAWLMSLLQERRLATASLKWHLEVDNEKDPTEKALKDGLTKVLKATPRLQSMMYYLLDAVWYGRYGSQLNYGWKWMDVPVCQSAPQAAGQPGMQAAPAVKSATMQKRRALVIERGVGHPGHIPVNGDKIGHKLDHTPYIMVHGGQDDQLPDWPEPIYTSQAKAMPLEGWLRERFILHSHEFTDADFYEAEQAEGVHGVGIRSYIYFLDWLKKEWVSNISDFMERAGLGVRLWYYQGGNADAKSRMEEIAKDNIRRINILIPRYADQRNQAQDTMEWKDVPTGGAEFLLEMVKWIDEAIERFVIGQTLSSDTEGSGLGGTGVADLHAATKNKIIAFDANNLADTLTEDWVRVVQYWTYPEYREVPVRFVFDVDQPDRKETLEAIKTYVDMGGKVPAGPVREMVGVPAPEEGDEVLSQQTMQAASAAIDGQQAAQQMAMQGEQQNAAARQQMAMEGQKQAHEAKVRDGEAAAEQQRAAAEQARARMGHPAEQFARDDLGAAVDEAAKATDADPSDAQKQAGNYSKGKVRLHGLEISIENPKGSTRSGKSKGGKEWSVEMQHHYGYIKRTESEADGDHVDVFIGDHPESEIVFVVDQQTEGGRFDEHKCMIGFTNADDAKAGYLANYSPGWSGFGGIKEMTVADFVDWVHNGDTGSRVATDYSRPSSTPAPDPLTIHTLIERLRRLGPVNRWSSAYSELDALMRRFPDLSRQLPASDVAWLRMGGMAYGRFEENEHPRGQPDNAGQFVKGGVTDGVMKRARKEKGAGKADKANKPATPAAPAMPPPTPESLDKLKRDWDGWATVGDGVHPTKGMYANAARIIPGLTPDKWRDFLMAAWDADALEMHVLNEVREADQAWRDASLERNDKLYGFTYFKDAAKMREVAAEVWGGGQPMLDKKKNVADDERMDLSRDVAGGFIADADGKPALLYHGTKTDFERFDDGRLGSGTSADVMSMFGHHFTEDRRKAGKFAGEHGVVKEVRIKAQKPYVGDEADITRAALKAAIENRIFDSDFTNRRVRNILEIYNDRGDKDDLHGKATRFLTGGDYIDDSLSKEEVRAIVDHFRDNLMSQGYDSIKYRNQVEHSRFDHQLDVIAFSGKQVVHDK